MHSFTIRVYYEDTDSGGIVYYANYLKFAERGRTEAMRSLGLEQTALKEHHGIMFVVKRAEIDFLTPARLDDLLTIESRLVDIKGAQLHMRQRILRGDALLAEVNVWLAAIGRALRPVRLPVSIGNTLAALLTPTTESL